MIKAAIKKISVLFQLLKATMLPRQFIEELSLFPQFLVLPVTYRCNLRCKSCSCPDYADSIGELSLSQMAQCLETLSPFSCSQNLNINLTGGEPFLRKDLSSIVGLFYDFGARRIGLSSNGYMTTAIVDAFEGFLTDFSRINWSIQLSVDGPEDIHNSIRGNNKSFSRVIETLDQLLLLKNMHVFGLSVNMTITSENVSEVKSLSTFIGERFNGSVGLEFTFAVNSDVYINSKDSPIGAQFEDSGFVETLRDIAIWLYRRNRDFFALDVLLMTYGYNRFTSCAFQGGGYFIEPSGDIYKCSVSKRSFVASGLNRNTGIINTASEALYRIRIECNLCNNNCGNYLYSNGIYDFLKSDFVQSRAKIYLASRYGDVFTKRILRKIGLETIDYAGQELADNEILFLVAGSKYCDMLSTYESDHRIHLIPIGLIQ